MYFQPILRLEAKTTALEQRLSLVSLRFVQPTEGFPGLTLLNPLSKHWNHTISPFLDSKF